MRMQRTATAAALAVVLCSCAGVQPLERSEIIFVTGFAESPPLVAIEQQLAQAPAAPPPPAPSADAWADRTLSARAVGSPPANWSSVETRRLMAKRDAMGRAWRAIGRQVEEMRIPGGATVGSHSKYDEAMRDRIQEIILGADVADERELPDGSYEVALSVNVRELASFLPPGGQGATPPAPRTTGLTAAQRVHIEAERARLRTAVRQAAEQDARRRLMEHVKARPVRHGRLIGGAMAQDPALDAQIQGLVAAAPVSAARQKEQGGCEVDLQFDMGRAVALASQR